MPRRLGWIAAAGALALLGVACEGTPDTAFNGGNPAAVPSWFAEQGVVLRFPDGSTLVSRYDLATSTSSVRKLNPNGTTATGWGISGESVVPFQGGAGSGARDGVVLADGSVVLHGDLTPSTQGSIRINPSGAVDSTYGSGGQRVTTDGDNGTPSADSCALADDGALTCVNASTDETQLKIQRYSPIGADLGQTSLAVNLAQFLIPGPVGTTPELVGFAADAAVDSNDLVVGVLVRTDWTGQDVGGSSERNLVLLRVRNGALDSSFGSAGYRLLDLEVGGTGLLALGSGDDNAGLTQIGIATDDTVGVVVTAPDPGSGPPAPGVARLTASGALDAAAAGGGLWTAALPDGTKADVTVARVKPTGVVTLGGRVPAGAGTRGVVVRYKTTGLLDTGFSTDGVADMAGTLGVHALDDRNLRVTVGGSDATIGSGGEADVVVSVLTG